MTNKEHKIELSVNRKIIRPEPCLLIMETSESYYASLSAAKVDIFDNHLIASDNLLARKTQEKAFVWKDLYCRA